MRTLTLMDHNKGLKTTLKLYSLKSKDSANFSVSVHGDICRLYTYIVSQYLKALHLHFLSYCIPMHIQRQYITMKGTLLIIVQMNTQQQQERAVA